MIAARVAFAVVLAAAVAGCGGGGEDRLSEDEWIDQADEICEEADEDADEIFADLDPEASAEDAAEVVLDELVPRVQEQIDDLSELNPPEDIEDDVDELLEVAQEALDDLEEAAEDDPESLFESQENPFAEVEELSGELGLDACAS